MEEGFHLGKTVTKRLRRQGVFSGIVKSYDLATQLYKIVYEDGDFEELNLSDLTSLLLIEDSSKAAPELVGHVYKPRLGRKPKKKRKRKSSKVTGEEESGIINNSEEIKKFRVCENGNDALYSNCSNINDNISHTDLDNGGIGLRNGELNYGFDLNSNCSEKEETCAVLCNSVEMLDEVGGGRAGTSREAGFDLNVSTIEKIDLDFNVNGDCDGNLNLIDLNLDARVKSFDLNVECDDESPVNDVAEVTPMKDICTNISEIGCPSSEGKFVSGISESLAAVPSGGVLSFSDGIREQMVEVCGDMSMDTEDTVKFCAPDIPSKMNSDQDVLSKKYDNLDNSVGPQKSGIRGRKRKKVLDNLAPVPEAATRRITRRTAAKIFTQNHDSTKIIPSPAVSDVPSATCISNALANGVDFSCFRIPNNLFEQELVVSNIVEPKELNLSQCKLNLPPSSQSLNLNGLPRLDLFSVYSFLRSFSTLLFLSPFELEDFVAALECKSPSSLLDFIHISILHTLRKHLEYLSEEDSQSASDCLRFLNWDLLDSITWPLFLVEYILIHGPGFRSEFDLSRLKLFVSDYYRQPASMKVKLLQCLCDDLVEAEAIRSELNRRSLIAGRDLNFDQNVKLLSRKKRKIEMEVSNESFLAEGLVNETSDWNSDDCCLCKMDGSLICCDGCPAAYHSRCVGVTCALLPEGEWYCPECIISKSKPWLKPKKVLSGAELLGTDPHGKLYFSSCGYLLVLDSCNSESDLKYYHRDDLHSVMDLLKSSDIRYGHLLNAISKHWHIPIHSDGENKNVKSLGSSLCTDNLVSGVSNLTSSIRTDTIDEITGEENPNIASAISPKKIEDATGKSCIDGEVIAYANQSEHGHLSAAVCRKKENLSQSGDRTIYVNYYSLARITSSVTEELLLGVPNKTEEPAKSVEDIIAMQIKAILKQSSRFHLPHIQTSNIGAQREKCGWCICCQGPDDDNDCLFLLNSVVPAEDKFNIEKTGFQKRPLKDYLVTLISQILSIESRLHGLLLGPWLNPHLSEHWRKSVLNASDVAALRHALLTVRNLYHLFLKILIQTSPLSTFETLSSRLEAHLSHLAISADWLKHVDSDVKMGSASHVLTSSVHVLTKHGISRKKGQNSDLDSGPCLNAETGLSLLWWRGGRVSRHLFNWKVLPRFLSRKAARQAGCSKIPGVLYCDGSEFAKRSKYLAWRSAVEMATSIPLLAFLVREFDSSIRWDHIENRHPLSVADKGLQKSIRAFKKVIVRRKCTEGRMVKYLLDFGKRKVIPDLVVKHGSALDESTTGRKRYLLEESFVPLHLLKSFEEKRIARKLNKVNAKLFGLNTMKNKRSRKGLSYLFTRAERSEYYQCGHCKRDVPIREAVSCQHCEGFFHKRHVKRSAGAITAEWTYTCHKCQEGKRVSIQTKKRIGKSNRGKTLMKSKLAKQSKKTKVTSKVIRLVKSQNKKVLRLAKSQNKKTLMTNVPLRRSPRKIKFVPAQNQKRVRRKKSKQTKSKVKTPKKPNKRIPWQKKRTLVHHTYWLNGLHLSKKPDEERVIEFKKKSLILSSENVHGPKACCSLCYEAGYTSTLNYIKCETCQDWFHADAFEAVEERICNIIGFRCHKCRKRTPPICPHQEAGRLDGTLLTQESNTTKVYVREKQKSHSDLDSKRTDQIDESNYQAQQSETRKSPALEGNSESNNGNLLISYTGMSSEKLGHCNDVEESTDV